MGRNIDKRGKRNYQGGRPDSDIAERDIGLRAKDAPPEHAGGIHREKRICNGGAMYSDDGRLSGSGKLQRAHRRIGRDSIPRRRPPAGCAPLSPLRGSRGISGSFFVSTDPKVVPIAPIGRVPDARRRLSRIMAPPAPEWGIAPHGGQCVTFVACCDAESVVVHPPLRRLGDIALDAYTLHAAGRGPPGAARSADPLRAARSLTSTDLQPREDSIPRRQPDSRRSVSRGPPPGEARRRCEG